MLGVGLSVNAIQQSYALPNGTEPTIFADFKNGVYMVESAPVALTDLIEESEAYSGWDPTQVEAGVGLKAVSGGNYFRLKKAMFATLGGSATIIPVISGAEPRLNIDVMDDPGFNNDFPLTLRSSPLFVGGARLIVADGSGPQVIDDEENAAGIKGAFSASLERVAGSLNGRSAIAMDTYNLGNPSAVPFDTTVIDVHVGVLETIGWYPLQDEADLPMLSAL